MDGDEWLKVAELAGVGADLDRSDTLAGGQLLQRQARHPDGEDAHGAALRVAEVPRGPTAWRRGPPHDDQGGTAERARDPMTVIR